MTDPLHEVRRGVRSINEPDAATRKVMLTPMSINEPLTRPDMPAPVVTSLAPYSAVAGDPEDIVMHVSGTGFNAASVIVFGLYDEPTTLNEDGTLSTGVKPSLFVVPDTVPVTVRNGEMVSNAVNFTFTDGAADPDELEDEIEQAVAEGDVQQRKPATRRRR